MMAMRAMRDNDKDIAIVARQHTSAHHGGEAPRARATAAALAFVSSLKLGAFPLPLVGRG
jgi:hypothetical protein